MRYAERITFFSESQGAYNPDTGKREPVVTEADALPCKITSLGIDRRRELFGDIDREIIVARLQQPYNSPVTFARANGKKYRVNQKINHDPRMVFYLEETI